ncbi:HD1 [Hepatospora eriocheir]|uniref:HD1 n=1 Tax=Hepatospora eriocheir TaxID=1081669 RepID=A0A1X0QET6_9MICR|nr:HD1 [Hepatospora eriocheir]
MNFPSEKRLEKICELKRIYRDSMKRIFNKVEDIETTLSYNNAGFIPMSSKNVIEKLIGILENAKKDTVNNITTEINSMLIPCINTGSFDTSRRAKRFSKKVIDILEESFAKDKYPNDDVKNKLANLCLITPKQVNNWFTNKRNRTKNCTHNNNFYRQY